MALFKQSDDERACACCFCSTADLTLIYLKPFVLQHLFSQFSDSAFQITVIILRLIPSPLPPEMWMMIYISSLHRNERIQTDSLFFSIAVHAGFNPKKLQ